MELIEQRLRPDFPLAVILALPPGHCNQAELRRARQAAGGLDKRLRGVENRDVVPVHETASRLMVLSDPTGVRQATSDSGDPVREEATQGRDRSGVFPGIRGAGGERVHRQGPREDAEVPHRGPPQPPRRSRRFPRLHFGLRCAALWATWTQRLPAKRFTSEAVHLVDNPD
jgi:hypothetical protein